MDYRFRGQGNQVLYEGVETRIDVLRAQVIVVTGGNRGVGEGMSKALAEANASVAIIYNSAKDAEDVAAGIAKEYGIKCQAYQCDVGQADRVKQVFDQIEKEMGQIAGLIANAGICIVKKAIDMTKADFDKQFEVNVLGSSLSPSNVELAV